MSKTSDVDLYRCDECGATFIHPLALRGHHSGACGS